MQSQQTAPIVDRLEAFTTAGPKGETMRLDAAADFEWDNVILFPSTMSTDQMGKLIGQDIDLDDAMVSQLTSDSAILMFRRGETVVDQVVVGPPLFLSGVPGKSYRRDDAILVVHTKDPGPYTALRFQD